MEEIMKSPQHMRIIQIDITNACTRLCSNCTRFCGHHKKPFFMDYETFVRAIDSMEGYVGTVGVMGGEPTLHPEFERFVQYMQQKYKDTYLPREDKFVYPQKNFMQAVLEREFENTCGHDSGLGVRQTVNGPGLFSAMGKIYRKYYELIQDTFRYQAVNDHTNPMYHQPALITRKELGIGDDEWFKLRDACWVQNEWSATITPKGAFFCEIAGALDMLFAGPGGWAIEKGWWKREISDFGAQLNWCELCGLACHTFTRDANEEIDDVSPMLLEKLKEINSPKLGRGKVRVVQIEGGAISGESKASDKRFGATMPYAESYEARFNERNSALFTHEFVSCVICEGSVLSDALVRVIANNLKQFDKVSILCASKAVQEQLEAQFSSVVAYGYEGGTLGNGLNRVLSDGKDDQAIVFSTDSVVFHDEFVAKAKKLVINPGTLHYVTFPSGNSKLSKTVINGSDIQSGFAGLLFKNALSLRELGFDRIAQVKAFDDIVRQWQVGKTVDFSNLSGYDSIDTKLKQGVRYAIYGAGNIGRIAMDQAKFIGADVAFIVDTDTAKHGQDFCGKPIYTPEKLISDIQLYDKVIVASLFYFYEIKQRLLGMGIEEAKIVLLG
jgi:hypothetical protein